MSRIQPADQFYVFRNEGSGLHLKASGQDFIELVQDYSLADNGDINLRLDNLDESVSVLTLRVDRFDTNIEVIEDEQIIQNNKIAQLEDKINNIQINNKLDIEFIVSTSFPSIPFDGNVHFNNSDLARVSRIKFANTDKNGNKLNYQILLQNDRLQFTFNDVTSDNEVIVSGYAIFSVLQNISGSVDQLQNNYGEFVVEYVVAVGSLIEFRNKPAKVSAFPVFESSDYATTDYVDQRMKNLPTASTSEEGMVTIGNNINVNKGVISLFTATTADLGIASFSGNYFNVTSGVVSSNIASSSSYGVIKVDNKSIKLNDKDQIYGLGAGSKVVASDQQSAESGGFYYTGGILYYKT